MCAQPIVSRWLDRRLRLASTWLFAGAVLALAPGLLSAQIGSIVGQPDAPLSCSASAAGVPLLRPEGYTELLGDVFISCTGGFAPPFGTSVPTANIILYILPPVPITSRMLGPSPSGQTGTFVSDAMLIIDEAGSSLNTGATGGYGPQAPQSLCTSAQQQDSAGSACPAQVGMDMSGQYQVSVVPYTTTPAQNVYQGEVGDFGVNSLAFYGVPVLPPAYQGVSRTFRITNIRIPVVEANVTGAVQVVISTSPSAVLPVAGTEIQVGLVGTKTATVASVNTAPAGGGNPFLTCAPPTSPTLAAQITFTEGFATAFKTRVVPGGAATGVSGNTTWAGEAQNLASPANQNLPGGFYGGLVSNNESGFILPALAFTDTNSKITYTAGLADFGTRLKAVFSNIPAGVTVYVSTTSNGSSTIPGGTSATPYAVLVAGNQGNEANGDGATFTPLTSTTLGSDGLFAYPLAADSSGVTAAIWEVVNANPSGIDSLTFSVYLGYGSTLGTYTPTNVALSYSPEPGGGTFPTVNATQGLDSPEPRFGVLQAQGGPFAIISACQLSANTSAMPFSYSIGSTAPSSQAISVTISPSNLPVTVTPIVTTPSGGHWLSASLSSGTLTISVNPAGLAASPAAYTGDVRLSSGVSSVAVPVILTVFPQPALSILKSHSGNFIAGQLGATYTITVSNGASAGPTSGLVTVSENPPSGISVVSMTSTGNVWTCNAGSCTTNSSLAGGNSYPPITVTVNVSSGAASPLVNVASVTGGGSATSPSFSDTTIIAPFTCIVTGGQTPGAADVQSFLKQALGISPPTFDLNSDGAVNLVDVQIVVNAALGKGCQ
jgi:large repetitive protein